MWRKINTLSLVGLIIMAGGVGLVRQVWAEDLPPQGSSLELQALATGPNLDATHAELAAMRVEKWLVKGEVLLLEGLPKLSTQTKPVQVRGLAAVRVTLRASGFTVGVGEAVREDVVHLSDAATLSMDMDLLLRRAAVKAFDELRTHLRDAELRTKLQGQAGLGTGEVRSIADVASRIAVDVQLAHHVKAIHISPKAPMYAILKHFAAGYHGLRLTDLQTKRTAIVWPASALAANITPNSQVVQLLSALDHPPGTVSEVARSSDWYLERFEVFHVVSPKSRRVDAHLIRGNRLLPPRAITAKRLGRVADAIARHLGERFTRKGLLRGTYHPTRGEYDPPIAPPDEALMGTYALTRYVHQQSSIKLEQNPSLLSLNQQAHALTLQLARAIEDDRLDASPALVALVLLTVMDNTSVVREIEVRDRMIARLLTCVDDRGQFHTSADPESPLVNHATSALATAALATAYQQTRRDDLAKVVHQAMNPLWEQLEENPNINALPWIMIAFERSRALFASDPVYTSRRSGLGDLIEKLIARQVVEPPRLGPMDVMGGFDLAAGAVRGPAKINWTTAQLLTFIVVAMRDPQVREGHNQLGWFISAGLAGRFLDQLRVTDASCYYMRSPDDAVGGIRLSLWDNRLTLYASAATLLAVTEFQQTLEALKQDE